VLPFLAVDCIIGWGMAVPLMRCPIASVLMFIFASLGGVAG